jgi:hypothetical protein
LSSLMDLSLPARIALSRSLTDLSLPARIAL